MYGRMYADGELNFTRSSGEDKHDSYERANLLTLPRAYLYDSIRIRRLNEAKK